MAKNFMKHLGKPEFPLKSNPFDKINIKIKMFKTLTLFFLYLVTIKAGPDFTNLKVQTGKYLAGYMDLGFHPAGTKIKLTMTCTQPISVGFSLQQGLLVDMQRV